MKTASISRRPGVASRLIEPLESRIAPAAIITARGGAATFTGVDGDLVTVKVSRGSLDAGNFDLMASGMGEQLRTLDLSFTEFAGANVSISAVPQAGKADGFVNLGVLAARGRPGGRWLDQGG